MTCVIEGCDQPVHNRTHGWCNKHYQRWWKHGDPLAPRKVNTAGRPSNRLEDVWKFVQVGEPDDCWPWLAAKRRRGYGHGYGQFTVARRSLVAHRVAFQVATGIDPGDLMVCHTCDNPPCCNPAHLFLGTAHVA